MDLESIYYI